LEFQAEPVVVDAEITIVATVDCIGSKRLDLLRQHSDIGLAAAVIGETVVTQSVLQVAQQRDIVLETEIRTASAASTASASTAAATESAMAATPSCGYTMSPACASDAGP
jgi:hypothetical protein